MVHNRSMAKSKLLFSSLNILIVCSILEAWQIAIGIRLGVYMLFGLLFLSIFFAYVIHNKHFEFAIDRAVIDLIYLYLGIYLISVITFVGIIIYSSNHPVFFTDALDQFSKFIINYIAYIYITTFCYWCKITIISLYFHYFFAILFTDE